MILSSGNICSWKTGFMKSFIFNERYFCWKVWSVKNSVRSSLTNQILYCTNCADGTACANCTDCRRSSRKRSVYMCMHIYIHPYTCLYVCMYSKYKLKINTHAACVFQRRRGKTRKISIRQFEQETKRQCRHNGSILLLHFLELYSTHCCWRDTEFLI